MIIIAGSIDLTKIDKSRIVEGKNGQKYYNVTVMVSDRKDDYGNDCSFQQGQTKEEREQKTKAVYIGNGKVVWKSDGSANTVNTPPSSNDNDSLPF